MSKNTMIVLVSLIAAVVIVVFPLVLIQDSEFGGADGQAEGVIAEISPGYEPWVENVMEPPGGETESMLFSLQAGIGTGVFAFAMGYLVARKKYAPKVEREK